MTGIVHKLAVAVMLLAMSAQTLGCAVSPAYQITESPNLYKNRYNTVFLGIVSSIHQLSDRSEVAEFDVLKLLKGEIPETIQVFNRFTNNCSTYIGEPGSRYYVFGNVNASGTEMQLDGFPSFVPERVAIESGMLEKLNQASP